MLLQNNYTTIFTSSTKPLSGIPHALKHYRLPINLIPYLPIGVDICLLELSEFIFNDNITKPIQISSKTDFEENANLTIVGYSWHRDINDTSTLHDAKHSSISFLSVGDCKIKERNFLICIGGNVVVDNKNDATYQANDASPIVYQNDDGNYMLSGMVVRTSEYNITDKRFEATATFLPMWCDWIRYITREEVTCK
uniref:Peptidase S1 domain-containing protein n=1 Tax=Panagrolaimus sp. ES5 TaxID=591445 RepID=A0AC34GRV6_9BILA